MSMVVGKSKYGMSPGTPNIKSLGPLAFSPDGILFLADNSAAVIFAVDLGGGDVVKETRSLDVDNLDTRLAAFLGCSRDDVSIRGMGVHPLSQDVHLSVMRGSGAATIPVLVKVGPDGALSEVQLTNVSFSQTPIENAPAEDDARMDVRVAAGKSREGEEMETRTGVRLRIARDSLRTVTVTDLAYADGVLLVAGASNEGFSSSFRRIPFPFGGDAVTNSLEIFHVSHGKYETASPIRTFVPYGANANILASYTCTPVVHFSLSDVVSGTQIKGRTVAELGSMNTPRDMISYKRDGQEYLPVSNTRHPLFKINCKDIDGQEALTEPSEPVGTPRETLPHVGVSLLANLNGSYVLMMQQDEAGNLNLRSYSSAAL